MRSVPLSFAVIFDMDGVLVDSEPLNIRVYVQAWSEFGVTLHPQEYVQRVTIEGMLIRSLFESHSGDPSDWDALFRRKTELYRELVNTELTLLPGALELLTDLRAAGIPRALATSAARVTMDLVFGAFGLAPYFEVTVALEDVARPKPDPEAFLKAAALLQTPPARCIVIEDALKGVAAGDFGSGKNARQTKRAQRQSARPKKWPTLEERQRARDETPGEAPRVSPQVTRAPVPGKSR